MIDYGKLTRARETLTDEDTGQDISVWIYRNVDGEDWLDLTDNNPSNAYIAVDDDNIIRSVATEADMIQIDGLRLIGLDSLPDTDHRDIMNKVWDGQNIVTPAEPLPNEISRRQFFQQLSVEEIISRSEALAAVQLGTIPSPLQVIIDQLPTEDDKFNAEMLIVGASVFQRTHPLTEAVRSILGWTVTRKNDFFLAASKL